MSSDSVFTNEPSDITFNETARALAEDLGVDNPLMISDQCIIKNSAGRCSCQNPAQMSDRMGSVFPVVQDFGCRNVIYNAHKLYLADKQEDLFAAGLWGARLLFTTETPREVVEVAKGYMGLSAYKPNVLTRGLYYRGVD